MLEPAEAHPELESELTVTADAEFDLTLFYDIAPPAKK